MAATPTPPAVLATAAAGGDGTLGVEASAAALGACFTSDGLCFLAGGGEAPRRAPHPQ